MEAGPEVRSTQPPHPQQNVDAEDLELYGSPDTVNIDDILNVDVTPLSSISTPGPDMSVITSVELDTSMVVDFDDRMREIQDTGAAPEIEDTAIGARRFRNPSLIIQRIWECQRDERRQVDRFLSSNYTKVHKQAMLFPGLPNFCEM